MSGSAYPRSRAISRCARRGGHALEGQGALGETNRHAGKPGLSEQRVLVLDEEAALLDLRVRDQPGSLSERTPRALRLLEALETRRHDACSMVQASMRSRISSREHCDRARRGKRGSAAWASPPMRRAMAFHVSAMWAQALLAHVLLEVVARSALDRIGHEPPSSPTGGRSTLITSARARRGIVRVGSGHELDTSTTRTPRRASGSADTISRRGGRRPPRRARAPGNPEEARPRSTARDELDAEGSGRAPAAGTEITGRPMKESGWCRGQHGPCRYLLAGHGNRVLADPRRQKWRGGGEQHVDLAEDLAHPLPIPCAEALRTDVERGRHERAREEASRSLDRSPGGGSGDRPCGGSPPPRR